MINSRIGTGGMINRIGTGTTRDFGKILKGKMTGRRTGTIRDFGKILKGKMTGRSTVTIRDFRKILKGKMTWSSTGITRASRKKITGNPMVTETRISPNPMGTSNSNYHEGLLSSTSRFSYRIGADRAEEIVDAARARTV